MKLIGGKILLVFLLMGCQAGSATLDLSGLPYGANEIQIIDQNMPDNLRSRYLSREVPAQVLPRYVTLSHYPSTDTSIGLILLYYSSGHGLAKLVLLECTNGQCLRLDETSAVDGGVDVNVQYADIDCDGISEVYTSCLLGAKWTSCMSIFSIDNNELNPLNPRSPDSLLRGLSIELVDRDSNCVKEIELTTRLKGRFSPDSLKTYRFDRRARRFIHSETRKYKGSAASKDRR